MRGRNSSAKSRLRSAGYKCNLCGRKVIDAATLERHRKTVHNIASKQNQTSSKAKQSSQRSKPSVKDTEKAFDALLKTEVNVESKPNQKRLKNNNEDMVKTEIIVGRNDDEKDEAAKNIENVQVDTNKKPNVKKAGKTKVEFQCPVCLKSFNAYFTALKHIQKWHPINSSGEKVAPNSSELLQPVRVEQCIKCLQMMKTTEPHICQQPVEPVSLISKYVCSGCKETFVTLKTFDMHVAGLHSSGVDSMFFPTAIEFTNWRLEMERQTNIKYFLLGEYDSKKIYRCNYAHDNLLNNDTTLHFCPSSMVVQDFSKGIQVHFYKKHYNHPAMAYLLASKYRKYSITSFLKNPTDKNFTTAPSYVMQPNEKELYNQFKKLMENIVYDAAAIDHSKLKTLIGKALDMAVLITESKESQSIARPLKPAKTISDKEIMKELEPKSALKRRMSVDTFQPKPAKRGRNKSMFVPNENEMELKIVNTFSLASNSNSEHSDDIDNRSTNSTFTTNDTSSVEQEKTEPPKVNTRSRAKEPPSFNDSYKQFITNNFKQDKSKQNSAKTKVKTKLGTFKPSSPKLDDGKTVSILQDIHIPATVSSDDTRESINSSNTKIDPATPKVTQRAVTPNETPSANPIQNVTPTHNVTPKVTSKVTPKVTSKVTSKVTPKVTPKVAPKLTPIDTPKVTPKVAPKLTPIETPKVTPKVAPKLTPIETPKVTSKVTRPVKVVPQVTSYLTPKVNPKPYPKVTPTFKDATNDLDASGSIQKTPLSAKKITEFKYEVLEQENDCNILILKF